jgi:hypothetical protein
LDLKLLRVAYAVEFCVAIIAVLMLWNEAGGQGHMDMMPWYWKLILTAGAAYAAVRATAAAVDHEKAWNRSTLRWISVLLSFLLACGLLTYYVHIYEPEEEEEGDEPGISRLAPSPSRLPSHSASAVAGAGEGAG